MGATFDSSGVRLNYKPDATETGSLFLSLACISCMALLFGRKTSATTFSSLNYARALVVILYVLSWLFSFVAALLAQTNDYNLLSCQVSIFACIFLYAGSKIIIYLFLIERVFIVTAIGVTRWNSSMFKFNILLLLPYVAIVILAIRFRVSEIIGTEEPAREGQCLIGLLDYASAPLIVYDVFLNCWLTILFLRSLISSTSQLQGPTKSKLREVARRTLIGSIFSLIFSTANISSIAAFKGYERGVICLSLCTLDVTLNAVTIHWITSRGSSKINPIASVSNGDRSSRIGPQTTRERHRSHLNSHISVSIESYVEEYHQMHIANKSPTSPSFLNQLE